MIIVFHNDTPAETISLLLSAIMMENEQLRSPPKESDQNRPREMDNGDHDEDGEFRKLSIPSLNLAYCNL